MRAAETIPFKAYQAAADFLREKLPFLPKIALVLGSGLGDFTKKAECATVLPYTEIPGFPHSSAPSHAGVLVCGRIQGVPALIFSGRFHLYEGYTPRQAAFYVRALKLLGVKTLILTNAAGGVNAGFSTGELMVITDHIKFADISPARGKHEPEFGERFFDMSEVYSQELRETALECAKELGIPLRQGVYFYMPGPEYETPAEIRAIRLLGGDAVGMSTVPEAVAAAQCGIRLLGISVITNMAAGILPERLSGNEVIGAAAEATGRFTALLQAIICCIQQ
ncbi:MAG: purine-nucleoside phosphorylase [Oscillospiraceae bacterium]|nr:purine-nucleoside phosphorylase [Oscillospiraceae bacterium]